MSTVESELQSQTIKKLRFREFSTRRLDVNSFRPEDAKAVAELAGDWEVAKWTASIPYPYPADAAERWIARQSEHLEDLICAIRANNKLIGCISFSGKTGEIGFWIGWEFWSQGFATEALCGLVDNLSNQPLQRLAWAACLPENARSIRVLTKAGFSPAGDWKVDGRLRHLGRRLLRFELQTGRSVV